VVQGAPEGLAEDGAGNLWIATFVQNALVVISPSGQLRSFQLPIPRALARTVTIGPDGAVWLLGARPPAAYRFQPPPGLAH
jgi:streptogramin lyase